MITSDVFRKIRLIELMTRKLVNDSFSGSYHSAFKGRGLEFDAIRPYEPGDDVRLIDWNTTARMGQTVVRQYIEERELTVLLLVDVSASCLFGTTSKTKRDRAAEVAAVLAYSALHNNDKVGLVLFSDVVEYYVPPNKGRNHTLRLIHDLLTRMPSQKGTDIAAALKTASRSLKQKAIIFLLSDFVTPVDTYATELSLLAYHHDVIALIFSDPIEQSMPDLGLVRIEDAETGQIIWLDTHASNWQQEFFNQSSRLQKVIASTLTQSMVDFVHIGHEDNYASKLVTFFQSRTRSRHQ